MSVPTPLNLTVKNGNGCAFVQWSAVQGATHYDIQIKSSNTWAPNIYQTNATCFLVLDLKNQDNCMVQVMANKTDRTTEHSITYKIKPRSYLSVFDFSVKRTRTPGQMRLQWTAIPTNVGYHIERCDIGHANKYISVGNIKDNKISTFEDKTCCDPAKLTCAGHQYKISAPDAAWLPNGSKSSAQVFCIRQPKSNNSASSTTANNSTTNISTASTATLPSSSSGATATTQASGTSLYTQLKQLFGGTPTTTSSPDSNSKTNQDATDLTKALPPQITVSK
jgi:hypothetical protein